jgi:uncharacterized membrane protein YcaP (DUF421 family)
MKKEDIHLGDLERTLFGEAPPIFLLEVFVRTLVVYIFLLYILRWLGKRMSGQLTIMELSVMLTLGAIVSASMQMPDHGVLEAFLLLLCALGFQRGISYLGVLSSKFEELTQSKAGMLIRDGVLQVDILKEFRISRHQIFTQLRNQKIYNLGKADRMYLEASGMYSVFQGDSNKPGLSVLPPNNSSISSILQEVPELVACRSCGFVQPSDQLSACNKCGREEWTPAIKA